MFEINFVGFHRAWRKYFLGESIIMQMSSFEWSHGRWNTQKKKKIQEEAGTAPIFYFVPNNFLRVSIIFLKNSINFFKIFLKLIHFFFKSSS